MKPGINWSEVRNVSGLALLVFIVFITLSVGGFAGCKEFNRYQKRADAKNRTSVVKQEIKTAEQQAQVTTAEIAATKARAEQRYQESVGIRRAQDEINSTLTPLYVQHEAIQALTESGAATVYIPSGSQGVPLVRDTSEDHTPSK